MAYQATDYGGWVEADEPSEWDGWVEAERAKPVFRVTEEEAEEESWNATRGLLSGFYGTLAVAPALGSMAAKVVGAEGAAESMAGAAGSLMDKAGEYQPGTSFDELVSTPTLKGALEWGMFTIGNVAPSMLVAGGAAGVGAKVATKILLKKAIKRNVTKGLTLKAATEQAVAEVAKKGAKVGLVGGTAGLEGGHMYMDDVEKHGVEGAQVLPHIVGGLAAGMVELGMGGVEIGMINKVFGKTGARMAEKSPKAAKSMLKKIWRLSKTSAGEAAQEWTQEQIAMLDEMFVAKPGEEVTTPWSEEGRMRGYESAAAGALIGVPGGMATSIAPEPKRPDFVAYVKEQIEDPETSVTPENIVQLLQTEEVQNDPEIVAGLTDLYEELTKESEGQGILTDIKAGLEAGNITIDELKAEIDNPQFAGIRPEIEEIIAGEEVAPEIKGPTELQKEQQVKIDKWEQQEAETEQAALAKEETDKAIAVEDERLKGLRLTSEERQAIIEKKFGAEIQAEKVESEIEQNKAAKEQLKKEAEGRKGLGKPVEFPEYERGEIEKPATAPEKTDVALEGEGADIFIRKPNTQELKGGTPRSRGIASIPDKEGFEKVYKPYGNTGEKADAGYYYKPIVEQAKAPKVEEAGTSIAEPKLSPELTGKVIYDGIQEGVDEKPYAYAFTDKDTKSSFLVKIGDDVNAVVSQKLDEKGTWRKPKVEKAEQPVHDYSSTQVNLPKETTRAIKDFGFKIPDKELYTEKGDDSYGREDKPHITVRYGLETTDVKDIAPAFEGIDPIKVRFGKVSIFESDNYDVVKIDVESAGLHKANKKVGETVSLPGETFKDYAPHATIAYVKKGEGKKYIGDKSLEGQEAVIDSVFLSAKDGGMYEIKLKPQTPKPHKPKPSEAVQSTIKAEGMPEVGVKPEAPVEIANKGKKAEVSVDMPKKEADALTPKEQKKYLMEEIDVAIESASDGIPQEAPKTEKWMSDEGRAEVLKKAAGIYKKNQKEFGTVTINVPGDGEFTILNNKQSLMDFKKKAKSFPASFPKTATTKKAAIKPSGKRLSGFEGEYYNEFKPRKQAIVGGVENDNGDIKQYYKDGWFISYGYMVKAPKPKLKNPIETKVVPDRNKVLDGIKDAKPAKLVGEVYKSIDVTMPSIPMVHAVTNDGEAHYLFDSKYIDAILTIHPKAKVLMADTGGLFFTENKKPVGMAMAVNIGYETGSLESLSEMAQKRYKEITGSGVTPKSGGSVNENIQHYKVSEAKIDYKFKQPTFNSRRADILPEGLPRAPKPHIRMATTGYIAADGNIVRDSQDAASLLSFIRKSAQEHLYGITTDKDGVVLEIHKYTKGTGSLSHIRVAEFAGNVLTMPEAKSFYFVHNHPAASAEASPPDMIVSNKVEKLLELSGIETHSLIIAGTKYSEFNARGEVTTKPIRPTIRRVKLPTRERVKTGRIVNGDMIKSSKEATEILKQDYGNADGFLLMDVKNRAVEFVPYPEGMKPAEATIILMSKIDASGAAAMIFNSPSKTIGEGGRSSFLKHFLEVASDSVVLHDIVEQGHSLADQGALENIRPKGGKQTLSEAIRQYSTAITELKKAPPLFQKRETSASPGTFKAAALQAEIDKITAKWKNAPEVEIVQSQSELPNRVQHYVKKGDIVDGVYDRGKVYIIADNMASVEATLKTLLHESFGHHGLRKMLGKDFKKIMQDVYIAKRKKVQVIADEYGFDIKTESGKVLAAEEWLAREAVNNPESGWVKRVMIAIRRFVRRLRPSLKLSDAEVYQIIEDARHYVERGAKVSEGLGAYLGVPDVKTGVNEFAQNVKFSLKAAAKKITDNPNFVKWFGLSPDITGDTFIDNLIGKTSIGTEPELAESIVNSMEANIGNITYFRQSRSLTDQIFNDLDIPRKRMVLATMGRMINAKPEIINSVIDLIPVDVVNNLKRKKLSPYVFLHDKSMLQNLFSVNSNGSVSLGSNVAPSFIRAVAFAITESNPSYMGFWSNDLRSTMGAKNYDSIFSTIATAKKSLGLFYPISVDFKKDSTTRALYGYHNPSFDKIDLTIYKDSKKVKIKSKDIEKKISKTKSKVVDKDGEPLVVYHGAGEDFNIFNTVSSEMGSHFGTKKQADVFITKTIMPVFINIKNPLRLKDQGGFGSTEIVDQLIDKNILPEIVYPDQYSGKEGIQGIQNILKKAGYDGIVYLNRREGVSVSSQDQGAFEIEVSDNKFLKKYPEAEDSYIAFEPTQIKSIFNTGAFDPANPDIRFQLGSGKATAAQPKPHPQSLAGILERHRGRTPLTPEQWADKTLSKTAPSASGKEKITDEITNDTISMVKNLMATKHVKFKEGKPDFKFVEDFIASPEFQFEKIPAASRVLKHSLQRRDDTYEFQKSLLEMGSKKDLMGLLSGLEKSNPIEHKKLLEFVKSSKTEPNLQTLKKEGFSFEAREAWHAWNRAVITPFEKDAVLMDAFRELKKTRKPEYKKLQNAILSADINKTALTANTLKAKGFSDLAVTAWLGRREQINRGLDMMISELRNEIIAYERAGIKPPPIVKTIDGKKHSISLHEALKVMGDARDHYSPRNRASGRYKVFVTKKNDHSTMFFSDLPLMALKRSLAIKYPVREGYKVVTEKAKDLSEDVFEDQKKVMNTQQIVNQSLEAVSKQQAAKLEDFEIKGEWGKTKDGKKEFVLSSSFNKAYNEVYKKLGGRFYDDKWHFVKPSPTIEDRIAKGLARIDKSYLDSQFAFASDLTRRIANTFEARGFLRHKIGRSEAVGKDVVKGFEEDPIINATQYVMGIAGGTSKQLAASRMMKAFTGTDVSWGEFLEKNPKAEYTDYLKMTKERGVSASEQKRAYSAVKKYIIENLRNEEFTDRALGAVKGLAVLKYLGLRIPSAAVNLTVLATSLPATMSSETGIPIHKTYLNITKAANAYRVYQFGDKSSLPKWQVNLFDEIRSKGWHQAQFNKEAIQELQTSLGRGYSQMLEWSMYMFGVTEQLNRVASIAGTYMALNKGGSINTEQLELAHKVSDLANGRYGKETYPVLAQGKGVGAQVFKMFYVFHKFSHTYLQNMYKMAQEGKESLSEKDTAKAKQKLKALSYMMFSPAVLAGVTGIPGWGALMLILEKVFDDDDPEEALYEAVEDNFGTSIENIARYGLPGMGEHGITIKHSLAIDLTEMPSKIWELGGAPANVIVDVVKGADELRQGHYGRAMEYALPSFAGRPFKAHREATEGVRTRTGSKVFVGRKQIKGDSLDTIFTTLGFSASRIDKLKGKRWHKIKVRAKYAKLRAAILESYKDYKTLPRSKRTKAMYSKIMKAKREYNKRVISKELKGKVPEITNESLGAAWRRSIKPTSADIKWAG